MASSRVRVRSSISISISSKLKVKVIVNHLPIAAITDSHSHPNRHQAATPTTPPNPTQTTPTRPTSNTQTHSNNNPPHPTSNSNRTPSRPSSTPNPPTLSPPKSNNTSSKCKNTMISSSKSFRFLSRWGRRIRTGTIILQESCSNKKMTCLSTPIVDSSLIVTMSTIRVYRCPCRVSTIMWRRNNSNRRRKKRKRNKRKSPKSQKTAKKPKRKNNPNQKKISSSLTSWVMQMRMTMVWVLVT